MHGLVTEKMYSISSISSYSQKLSKVKREQMLRSSAFSSSQMNEKWLRDNKLPQCALSGNCLGWCVKIKAAPCLCVIVILFHTCCVPARTILRLKNSLFPANNSETGFCLEFSSLSCRDFLFKSLRWLVTARTFATQAQ